MSEKSVLVLVKKMREAQRIYFRSRSPYVLKEAKALEARVDAELSKLNFNDTGNGKQAEIFSKG
jgi:hypothetical protein